MKPITSTEDPLHSPSIINEVPRIRGYDAVNPATAASALQPTKEPILNMALPSLAPTPADRTAILLDHGMYTPPSQSSPMKLLQDSAREDDGSSTCPPEEELTFEYHGPGSFLSICSKSGIEWVAEKTGVPDFGQIAQNLASDVSRALKLSSSSTSSTTRAPEPEEQKAWEYTKVYFEEDPDARYGLINRSTFEPLLRAHLKKDGTSEAESDPAWYALRNTVYAAGCRIVDMKTMSKSSKKSVISPLSWSYFLNALSVHTDLLYFKTSLMAVQALAMMAVFVEAIGCPSIDYMLCSCAMKLAQAKGLHRQPAAAWNLSKPAIQSRSFLWWTLYGYERMNASRSGRPLSISDEDITCQLPNEAPADSRMNFELLLAAMTHSRLSGLISRRIGALKQAEEVSLQRISETIADLSQQLDDWWNGLPEFVKKDLNASAPLPPNVLFLHVAYLHYAHYSSLVAIHSILVHPWNSIILKIESDQKEEFAALASASMDLYLKATRRFIHNLPQVDMNALTPKWQVVFITH
ncbi:uncharacterized protein Z519_08612 [Cladophialophora bantiana CBS 173.52]|uniref:Xylanolytic transcriptional activator regulatory domain-containing protein n=1 Tax=Cladophialophora bantiana (strain ATCC 10958 / CBS 173.52 / CDC B-1940 / NIH 8579) TaxID=1442370 RepID=A0A0D2I1P6_CLAB1|nr:uncharacterized protein Z519_08612 [Cladophialophora bantiana CBS 173.52]KIW90829.1 hypothetical protein Z519_08612 [Cladophialophora bantiana CBS 173.52]